MFRRLLLICFLSIFAESYGGLTFLPDLPRAFKNTTDAFFATVFGKSKETMSFNQHQNNVKVPPSEGVGQKAVDTQGDGNVNQNVNVNLNNGTLVLSKPEDLGGQLQEN